MTHSPQDILNDFDRLREEYISTALKFFSVPKEDEKNFCDEISWGAIKPLDALALAEIVLHLKPKKILEIGSFLGLSTRWLLELSAPWGAQLTSIDPNIPHRAVQSTRPYFNQFCASHRDRLTTIDAFASFSYAQYNYVPVIDSPIGEFDFTFLDGDHSFGLVVQNSSLVASMMGQGGVIVGHDVFTHKAVAAATTIAADILGVREFCFISRAEVSLGSIWKWAQWNKNKQLRESFRDLAPPRGRQDGLTMMHLPKSETTRASSVRMKQLYGKKSPELHDELLPKREKILKKHLLKRTIADQLRRWGY